MVAVMGGLSASLVSLYTGKGSVVGMNPETRLLYRNVIEWEQKKKLTLHGDSVLLGTV